MRFHILKTYMYLTEKKFPSLHSRSSFPSPFKLVAYFKYPWHSWILPFQWTEQTTPLESASPIYLWNTYLHGVTRHREYQFLSFKEQILTTFRLNSSKMKTSTYLSPFESPKYHVFLFLLLSSFYIWELCLFLTFPLVL